MLIRVFHKHGQITYTDRTHSLDISRLKDEVEILINWWRLLLI